jgi:hypothetical protein
MIWKCGRTERQQLKENDPSNIKDEFCEPTHGVTPLEGYRGISGRPVMATAVIAAVVLRSFTRRPGCLFMKRLLYWENTREREVFTFLEIWNNHNLEGHAFGFRINKGKTELHSLLFPEQC